MQSSEAATGKRVGKDAERGKLTFPGLLGLDQSTQHAEQLIAEACEALAPFGAASRRACRPWPATSWKGIADGQTAFDDQLARRSQEALAQGARAVGRRDARGPLPPGRHADGPFRLEPGRGRVDAGPAHHVRFQPRPPDLGHRPSGLRPQDGHRPLRRVPHDAGQGRPDGLSQSGRKRLRPVHDRPRRLQRRHGAWA